MADFVDTLMNSIDDEGKARVQKRAQELKEEYLSLQELRKKQEITQEDMAGLLGIKQCTLSQIENRSDWKVSTLHDYAQALGAHLEINFRFSDDHTVSFK